MERTFVFPSLARPNWRYRLYSTSTDNPADNWRRSSLSSHISQYDTMGDGEIQHSPDCQVQNDDVFDVVASLYQVLDKIPLDEDDVPSYFRWFWRTVDTSDKVINFVLGLKYNEKKDTFVNLAEMKKSHSYEKSYDKRWHRLSHCDVECPIEKVMRVITSSSSMQGVLEMVGTAMRVAELADSDCATFLLQKYLTRGTQTIFSGIDQRQLSDFLRQFEQITEFRNAALTVTYTRRAARAAREKNAEAQVATAE